MLSRVADSLYWTSRYLERAEHTVRILDVNIGLMLDKSQTSAERRWRRVLAALGHPTKVEWSDDAYALVHTLCFDTSRPASVTACIISARENARQIREEISSEQWQRLNRLFHEIAKLRTPVPSDLQMAEFLPAVIDGIHLFQGVSDTTLSHGEGWQFLQLGRFLERASVIATLLEVYHRDVFMMDEEDTIDAYEYLEWIGLLRTCTAFEAYCKVYTADLTYERILEFLLLNAEFPHSLRYSIDRVYAALEAVEQQTRGQHASELMRIAGRLKAQLSYSRMQEILEQDTGRYLRSVLEQCWQIHAAIYEVYIQYSVQTALAV
ncbi:alpha-E domain-containing protein [Acidipila rosea]|uniref:Putative alpha-E superfamily protein n=1 Tax=Acidipila rosea TaxID=768535 RepID=A0A4R1LE50_9BACT|nr:alpha-E domain-containing protein [Acidipila rosea]MBW4025942.1 alpha-E domain-containing protein [Acidobacteriota bacterium]MBW4044139.1 alpha-E domain-containing protein [Acidobacteriota bacterium]TCK75830.1 putative alpha-E superfamily protein [Acidipila rosea]